MLHKSRPELVSMECSQNSTHTFVSTEISSSNCFVEIGDTVVMKENRDTRGITEK
jgi:hypothetical protein